MWTQYQSDEWWSEIDASVKGKKKIKIIPMEQKEQHCTVTAIIMHACLVDALDWKAPLYFQWGYV